MEVKFVLRDIKMLEKQVEHFIWFISVASIQNKIVIFGRGMPSALLKLVGKNLIQDMKMWENQNYMSVV
ncbi:MAG: hypothetical protein IJN64_16110 [Lachnospiraceae bacterium]|nr:hypothetical protein [Lachnospiraceae bacterium]